MKKIMLLTAGIVLVLSMVLSPAVALAGPPTQPDYGNWNPTGLDLPPAMEDWGLEKALPSSSAPGGEVHIVTDLLAGDGEGWVTFWCQSKVGFQYNIGTTGLDPLSEYSVNAYGVQILIVPEGTPGAVELEPGLWVDFSTLTPVALDLGTFKTDANGRGGVKGVTKLPSGYVYEVAVVVFDGDGVPVLEPGLNPPPFPPTPDTNGFIVY
jgi:hypothetical protein